MPLAGPSQRFREHMHLYGLDRAIRLRHGRDPDERIVFDVRHRPLLNCDDRGIVIELHVVDVPLRALTAKRAAAHLVERTAHSRDASSASTSDAPSTFVAKPTLTPKTQGPSLEL